MNFVKATLKDVNDIVELVNSAYRGEISKNGWTTETDLVGGIRTDEKQISNLIEEINSQIELAFIENQLVGLVYLKKEKLDCYLGLLSVNPFKQTNGIGKAILTRSEIIAKNWQCNSKS